MEKAPIKILLVEDNPGDARLLRAILREIQTAAFELTHAKRLSEALQRIATTTFDIGLIDLMLPDSQGLETFQKFHALSRNMPVVVLSGVDDETLAIAAVREGAQDYLAKGRLDAYNLSRSIRYAIERHRVEQALAESEKHYKHLLESITDYTFSVKLAENVSGALGQSFSSSDASSSSETLHKAEHGKGPETSPQASDTWRLAHGIDVGLGCAAVTGYTPADYQAEPALWLQMVHAEDRPAVIQQASKVLAGETPAPLEHRILHKNGQVRWVRSTVVPCRDEQGKVAAYDGLITDITERKRAEEKLVRSEAFYHSLVENLPQNIFRKDVNERFTFANQRFCALLGKPLEEIIGKTDFDFYPPELAAKYQADDRMVMRTGRSFETVEENIAPNGETIYVSVVKVPIYDSNGNILGTQCIFWDITERKRWEERLQQANRELASSEAALRRSNEELRSAQLQLIQAEKMESIGTLAAGVAHEVKNPLAIILMGINYLSKKIPANRSLAEPASSDASKSPAPRLADTTALGPPAGGDDTAAITMVLNEMREAVERANTITRGLLDFSSSRQLAVKPEDLNQILDATLKLVRHELSQRKIDLVKQKAPRLPLVAVDKTQIQQVFVNVFVNAIHAMPEGGTLTVRTYAKSMTETTHFEGSRRADHFWVGDTAVVAEVEDTGCGIPQENLAKIFDPFFTTKPTGVGTGLGLPVSKKIIELHGGAINIKNKPGGGGVRVTIMFKQAKS